MDKQNELLRLIVQKMEIRTESNEQDGGDEEHMQHSVGIGGSRFLLNQPRPIRSSMHWSRSANDLRDIG